MSETEKRERAWVSGEIDHPVRSGFSGHCPRCGKGKLFAGFLQLAERCDNCDLDYGFADSADAPAVFVILLAGFVTVVGALLVEVTYQPPYWIHAVLWLPLAILLPLTILRPLKGAMVGLQYKNRAREARFGDEGNE